MVAALKRLRITNLEGDLILHVVTRRDFCEKFSTTVVFHTVYTHSRIYFDGFSETSNIVVQSFKIYLQDLRNVSHRT